MDCLKSSFWEEERREVFESVLECLERHPDADERAACRALLAHLRLPRLVPAYLESL